MIDRNARGQMVLLLRRLATGRMTNHEFDAALPTSRTDPAVDEIYYRGAWGFYSDLSEHRLIGRHRLSRTERREIARFILFLKSDLDYEWPRRELWGELLWMLAGLLTLGLAGRLYWRRLGRRGDVSVWPFLRGEDFERVVHRPCYLAGAGR
jgi:hypothetical protein